VNAIELLGAGGAVLWLIIGAGLLAMGVFLERTLHLHRARIRSDDFLKGIFTVLGRRSKAEALSICEETPGPVAYVVKTAILHRDDDKETLRRVVSEASAAEVSRMERRLVVVASVAQIAPLLGLLGTVISMIDSLLVMQAQAPLVHSGDLLTGLLGALVTTAAGLMVAIPCYAAFHLLVVKIDRIVLDMERASSEIVAYLAGAGREEPAA